MRIDGDPLVDHAWHLLEPHAQMPAPTPADIARATIARNVSIAEAAQLTGLRPPNRG